MLNQYLGTCCWIYFWFYERTRQQKKKIKLGVISVKPSSLVAIFPHDPKDRNFQRQCKSFWPLKILSHLWSSDNEGPPCIPPPPPHHHPLRPLVVRPDEHRRPPRHAGGPASARRRRGGRGRRDCRGWSHRWGHRSGWGAGFVTIFPQLWLPKDWIPRGCFYAHILRNFNWAAFFSAVIVD